MAEPFTVSDIVVTGEDAVLEWDRYFDHIYCIHFLPYKDRLDEIRNELQKVRILDSGLLEFMYTYRTPFDSIIRNRLPNNSVRFNDPQHQDIVTNVTLTYYRIFKEATGRGFNRVLVVEDDCVFDRGTEDIRFTLEHIPPDWDYIHFDKMLSVMERGRLDTAELINNYISTYSGGYWGTVLTAFSEKAMRLAIELLEEKLYTSDGLLENHDDPRLGSLRRYVPSLRLCYQRGMMEAYTKYYT